MPIDVPDDGQWHELSLSIPDSIVQQARDGVTALNLIIALPPAHLGTVALDDVEVLEWRGRARADRPVWAPADLIRSTDETAEVVVRSC